MKEIQQLIDISRHYGGDSRYVIAGGGNTSYKNADRLWVKASGFPLATITEEGFAVLDRAALAVISERNYPADAAAREEAVKNDLAAATLTAGRRPSVETSMHNAIRAAYVVHLHPTLVGGLMCGSDAERDTARIFGDSALYIPYIDPGYTLFKAVERGIADHKARHGFEPKIILLQNHGVFVGADTTDEIRKIYDEVFAALEKEVKKPLPETAAAAVCDCVQTFVPALRMLLSKDGLKTVKIKNSALIQHFTESEANYARIGRPFTPDAIVYCKSNYLYFDSTEGIVESAKKRIAEFTAKNGYTPKVILVKGVGLLTVGDNAAQCETIESVFEDAMKVAWYAQSFGGEHPMSRAQIDFIDNWEVENYRRKIAAGASAGRVENKTIIVTGAAQGFGEGIARCLVAEGANIVVADLNEAAGEATARNLCALARSNRAIFVKTNVADMESLRGLMHATVCAFGGVDVFVSNAGVLRAGGLEDMTPENFEFVTRINYNAYFFCAKAVAPLMKQQTAADPTCYCDIIQVNSKSGLRGSKANFAYAGGKFGGIGLTQSFALELAPFRIKVNSICPGNFYDGPLWSDPDNGLFVQYLKAGKVPGAKTVDDVREFYLAQVPMRKGCSPEDVTKGLLYLVDQTGETGQALPITGGQVMLN